MALLVLGDRVHTMRVDLATLEGVAAVADVPPGAHHVSVLDTDGWRHGWVFVDPGADVVALDGDAPEPAADAVVALPPDDGTWSSLTDHLDSRAALVDAPPADVAPGATRFEQAASGSLLADLQRSFVEWVLPTDGGDQDAGERWRKLVVAVAAAGPRGIEQHAPLVASAVEVIAAQLAMLPPTAVGESLRDALGDLADDLAEVDADAGATLRAALV